MTLTRRTLLIGGTVFSAGFARAKAGSTPLKLLTACFSRTGNTALIAGHIHEIVGGSRFDIIPVNGYPEDYRATVEQARREQATGYRPALSGHAPAPAAYDVMLLGYPIWAMTLPPVVRTFLERQDFSNKIIAPFCTHKGYGRGESMSIVARMAPQARLLDGFDMEGVKAASARAAVAGWLRDIRVTQP